MKKVFTHCIDDNPTVPGNKCIKQELLSFTKIYSIENSVEIVLNKKKTLKKTKKKQRSICSQLKFQIAALRRTRENSNLARRDRSPPTGSPAKVLPLTVFQF